RSGSAGELDPGRALEVAPDERETGQRSDELGVSGQELERLLTGILPREELVHGEADLALQLRHHLVLADEEPGPVDLEQRVPDDVARLGIDGEISRRPAGVHEALISHREL